MGGKQIIGWAIWEWPLSPYSAQQEIRICSGYDAVNCAFTRVYGQAQLSNFEVWSYRVDPGEVSIGDPIDLSKRLCGTPQIRFPYAC